MQTQVNGTSQLSNIQFEINKLRTLMEEELHEKRELIRQKDAQIQEYKNALTRKKHSYSLVEARLKECELEAAGNRQLINKLLGDISKLHNDIEWYDRTYRERSFLGVIKEKIISFRKK